MVLITWEKSFELGITDIDDQHKKLITLINELHDAMSLGKGRAAMNGILSELLDYTHYHFKTEEDKLSRNSYPKLDEHKDQHSFFITRLAELKKDHLEGEYMVTLELNEFLKEWLSTHILRSDKEFASFLRSRGEK